jgi:DNA polymerase III epsilon subunit-like protein
VRANKFDGFCDVCSVHVQAGGGSFTGTPGRWRTRCLACSPAPPHRGDHDGWHRVPLASLDFETTGVDPRTDRVLSYALLGGGAGPRAADGTDEPGFEITGLVDPGIPIPPASAEVHGITGAMLADAPPSAEGMAVVVDWVQSLVERRVGLVVFNAAYDLTMLRAEATRLGLVQPDWSGLLVVDPFIVDWGIERGALGQRRLVDVAEYYGIAVDHAHDAACDARAAREVAIELGSRHVQIGATTLIELMVDQRTWHIERALEWNAYAARKGRPIDDLGGWPLAG